MQNKLTKPLAHYPHARRAGDLLYLAGQGCRSATTNECVGLTKDSGGNITHVDIHQQTRGVFANIDAVLQSEGLERSSLIDISVFLTSMDHFAAMNEVWNEYFADISPPTRTTVAVADLPGENFVEMKAIATTKNAK